MQTKKPMRKHYSLLLLLAFVALSLQLTAQTESVRSANELNNSGLMTFTVRTVSAGGNYAPKHVLAIWIEDANGFVKTRLARANARKQYLVKWRAASNYNTVDATTGATLPSHQTHTVSWNCSDLQGNELPDGNYNVYVEFTDKNGAGPFKMLTFTKGPDPQHLTPADETFFKDLDLEWFPDGVGIDQQASLHETVIYPSPNNGIFQVKTSRQNSIITVYNAAGQAVFTTKHHDQAGEDNIDISKQPAGVYFVEVADELTRYVQNILKQ